MVFFQAASTRQAPPKIGSVSRSAHLEIREIEPPTSSASDVFIGGIPKTSLGVSWLMMVDDG